ncbi:Mgl repressor and galactose ultrainduction factor GalS, HTH-type transcriptional regulator [Cronobacter universalis NCTC 9529]|nr:GTP cyclohydrolase I [Cronobacter universalis]CCK15177.1 Mgl repressor and galactose ultrainduction factor GalS, HTH-type transcriptional regulator [Cronobacter universalis NCTC 9529]
MITIRDVARLAGVSVATVSRVLNNSALVSPETRETVMQAVTQLGYRPNANAQALATQVSDTIGVVVMDVSDPFFGALVKAVDVVAQQHGKYVLIGNSYHEAEKERHAIEVLIRQRCSALIVHAKSLSDDELSTFLEQVPGMVLINRIVQFFAQRPQVQERLTQQVLVALQTLLGTNNVAVSIDAVHYCVKARGIRDATSATTTTSLGGLFKSSQNTRQEFLRAVRHHNG